MYNEFENHDDDNFENAFTYRKMDKEEWFEWIPDFSDKEDKEALQSYLQEMSLLSHQYSLKRSGESPGLEKCLEYLEHAWDFKQIKICVNEYSGSVVLMYWNDFAHDYVACRILEVE